MQIRMGRIPGSIAGVAAVAAVAAAAVAAAAPALAGVTHQYEVTFDALWSQEDHPTNFPIFTAHFSPLVGASHGGAFDFWSPGETASVAVERVAEIGSATQLITIINNAISDGDALTRLSAGGPNSPGSISTNTMTVSDEHPLVSLITMVAPSHDWFVGVDSLDVRNSSGVFQNRIVIDLPVWDAGTEPGSNFSTSGQQVEGGVIHLLPNVVSIFGSDKPTARLTFERVGALVGDLNSDGVVDTADLGLLIGAFGSDDLEIDMNGDQIIDTADLGLLIGNFGAIEP